MTETLMQICMKILTQLAILLNRLARSVVYHKLLQKSIAQRGALISIGEVSYGHTLRPMLGSNPIGIRKIYPYGCRRIFITAEHSCTNHIGRHSSHGFLLEHFIHRRIVFKPLRMLTDKACTLRGFDVFIVHNAFPRTFQAQWVAINFYEAIDKIYPTILVFQPFN